MAGSGSGGSEESGWVSRFRSVPLGWRAFLVALINLVGLIVVASFIAKGAAGVDAVGLELQRVRHVERLFTEVDAETDRIQRLIQHYFVSPADSLLEEIGRRRGAVEARAAEAAPYGDEIAAEIQRTAETTRALIAGFDGVRALNAELAALYDKDFLGAIGGVSVRFAELDHAGPIVPFDLDRLIAQAREQASAALLETNTYVHTRSSAALVAARLKLAGLGETAKEMRTVSPGAETRPMLDGLDQGLASAGGALDRLAAGFERQSRQMQASIADNEAALATSIARVGDDIQAREASAHATLETALATMRGRVVGIGLLFIAASLVVGVATALSIGRPIAQLRATMLAIVAGDTSRAITGTGARDEVGAMARAVEVFRENVVARQRADQERAEQARRWRSVLDTSPIGIAVVAGDTGERLYENRKYRALFNVPEPGTGEKERPFHESFADPQEAVRLADAVRRFGGVSGWEVGMVRAEGGPWWCLMEVRAIEFEGRAAHIFWHYDVTDRRRAQDDLRAAKEAAEAALQELRETQANLVEAEKLAAIGGLVAGVAHEVNNPVGISLTVASSLGERAEIFAGELERGALKRSSLDAFVAASREATRLVVANLQRAADLVRAFKQVAVDRVHAERRRFDLKETVDQILASLRPSLKTARHRLVAEIEPGIEMDSYPGQLGQVVTNLFMNALTHAFDPERDGVITVTARRRAPGVVELVVADTGVGMSEETQRRAFDPFYTTRRGQGGTGLGLHIVYNIVTLRLGGTIELVSAPGEGTRFVIVMPATAPSEPLSGAAGEGMHV
jgi:signal transduction histidine kinase/HAMP domain-containing protein